jgi:acyl-CoA synthetase (AMP-forming)/AMP-acid ligase II
VVQTIIVSGPLSGGQISDGHSIEPSELDALCQARLAKFKWPRYFGFRKAFPLTASAKVAKHEIKKETPNLILGAYDIQEKAWVTEVCSDDAPASVSA